MSETMRKLIELAPKLKERTVYLPGGAVCYDVESGESVGKCLFEHPYVSVQQNRSSAGTVFTSHRHDEHELIIVERGEFHLEIEGKNKIIMRTGDITYIPPGQKHRGFFPVETWCIGITAPAGEGYPHERKE